MKFAIVMGVSFGIMAGVWLEDVGISIIGSTNIAIAVGYSWYRLTRELQGLNE